MLEEGAVIYLDFGRVLRIPVNPQEIKTTSEANTKEYTVLGVGQVVVMKRPKLKTISWESFFPEYDDDPYVNDRARLPVTYVKAIETAMQTKRIGRVIISRSDMYNTSMACIITNFETTDRGGEPGDMYYSISLQEYRSFAPQTVTLMDTSGASTDAIPEEVRPVDESVLRVGATVSVTGEYSYTSSGKEPHRVASNVTATVKRIEPGADYPILIDGYGWVQMSAVQVAG